MINWQETLIQNGMPWDTAGGLPASFGAQDLGQLRAFLDAVHIRTCLIKPYQQSSSYPVVESRELLPSFDSAMFEYKNLPGFSLVAFERPLSYFEESFQYDMLRPPAAPGTPQAKLAFAYNLSIFSSRLPRAHHDVFRTQFSKESLSHLASYPNVLPYLLNMDRAHVLSLAEDGGFHLSGIYASFINNIDAALKHFGLQIGRFVPGDNDSYADNRMFVYQYLMELYGFPVVSERRTSAAMFARLLHSHGERFLLRVLGQTDRTITTYVSDGTGRYPKVDKIALVSIDKDQTEAIDAVEKAGGFLDPERRVVILRVTYRQHSYDATNVRQDRALSVATQEVIHPLTGRILGGLNIVRDATNMYLRLNDIVHGEYTGRIVYRRTEVIESTESDENRLKVLSYWLSKHQRRMIDYSDEFYAKVSRVVTGYLNDPERDEIFEALRELHLSVRKRFSYIRQARRVRTLEDLSRRTYRGEHLNYRRTLDLASELANELKFEIVDFFPELVEKAIACLERILSDRYLIRTYMQDRRPLTEAGQAIRRDYRSLVAAMDEFRKVLKARNARKAAPQGE